MYVRALIALARKLAWENFEMQKDAEAPSLERLEVAEKQSWHINNEPLKNS